MIRAKIRDLGEFGVIERVSRSIRVDGSVIKGIGDDAAVIKLKGKGLMLFASDMIIEGVHFDLKSATPFEIGHKALGVNISDIAAMGGVPRYASISLGAPKNLDVKILDGIYRGLKSIAKRYNVNICTGDTTSSNKLIIDAAIIGEVGKREVVFRSGARRNDVILVTGRLGGSMKGRHLRFLPRVDEARFLVKNFKINSMIDISDGLSSDLAHICRESRAGAKIYESLIPISKDARSVGAALNDGEDFELLFTVSGAIFKDLIRDFKKNFNTPIAAIGEITNKKGAVEIVGKDGKASSLKKGGFRHF